MHAPKRLLCRRDLQVRVLGHLEARADHLTQATTGGKAHGECNSRADLSFSDSRTDPSFTCLEAAPLDELYRAHLEGPAIYHLSFCLFAVGPKNAKCPRMGLRIGLRGGFVAQPALFFEPGPFPGLPGPAVGPKGPKIGLNPGLDLSFYPP